MLSKTQTEELNKAILEYLVNAQFADTAKVFAGETNLKAEDVDPEGQKLSLKWKSIISLTKKIANLEDQLKQMAPHNGVQENNTGGQNEGIDIQIPERLAIKGHKNNVTSVSFHPEYT